MKTTMQTKRRRAPGEGTFIERTRKLKNGSVVKEWVHVVSIGYDHSGQRVRRWISGKSKSELQLRVAKLRAENGGKISRRPTETTGEWIDKWLAGVKKSRAATTVRSYEERLRRYVTPNIGKVPLADLDAPKIAWLYETLETRGVSADNIGKVHKALRRALNVALGQGLIVRNPTSHVARPAHRTKRRDAYDAAEVGKLLKAS